MALPAWGRPDPGPAPRSPRRGRRGGQRCLRKLPLAVGPRAAGPRAPGPLTAEARASGGRCHVPLAGASAVPAMPGPLAVRVRRLVDLDSEVPADPAEGGMEPAWRPRMMGRVPFGVACNE